MHLTSNNHRFPLAIFKRPTHKRPWPALLWSLLLSVFVWAPSAANGQVFANINESSAFLNSIATAAVTTDPTAPSQVTLGSIAPHNPGLLGYNYHMFARALTSSVGINDCGNDKARAGMYSWARVHGSGTPITTVVFDHGAHDWANILVPTGFAANVFHIVRDTISLTIPGTPGTNTTLFYGFRRIVGAVNNRNEAAGEDAAAMINNITVDGQTLIPNGTFNMQGTGFVWGHAVVPATLFPVTGNVSVPVGESFDVVISSIMLTAVNAPGRSYVAHCDPLPDVERQKDRSWAYFGGVLGFSLNNVFREGYVDEDPAGSLTAIGDALNKMGTTNTGQLQFSVDIGSDTELSDIYNPGNEGFDPADLYNMGGAALPNGGANGVKNDYNIWNTDPWPTPGNTNSKAPIGQNGNPAFVARDYLDVDGADQLSIALSSKNIGQQPVAFYQDDCIHQPRYMYLSFDDDDRTGFTWSSVDGEVDVPNTISSAILQDRYGSAIDQNEIIEDHYVGYPGLPGNLETGVGEEKLIHVSMNPSPVNSELQDDDIDALDIVPTEDKKGNDCGFYYFSVDHEAHYEDLNGKDLNPGAIYEVGGTNTLSLVVDPTTHLGLPQYQNEDGEYSAQVDLDAFEFVWMQDPATGDVVLALLFSVDDNDPLTVEDESAGLEPGTIYYSFLDGDYGILDDSHLEDDIDAITCWKTTLTGKIDDDGDGGFFRLSETEIEALSATAPEAAKLQLEVFPVPATDEVHVLFPGGQGTYTVVDVSGKQLSRGTVRNGTQTLDISQLPVGMYFLTVDSGDQRFTAKFVKE